MGTLRGALIGCGFFARNHMHGWKEIRDAEIAPRRGIVASGERDCNEECRMQYRISIEQDRTGMRLGNGIVSPDRMGRR